MMGNVEKENKKPKINGLIDLIFSWSLTDVMNEDLYRNQVCFFCIFLIPYNLVFFPSSNNSRI